MLRNLPLTVHLVEGDPLDVVAIAPDVIRWERAADRRVSDLAEGVALDDLARIAYYALKREGRIEGTAKYERWIDQVSWVDEAGGDAVDPTSAGA